MNQPPPTKPSNSRVLLGGRMLSPLVQESGRYLLSSLFLLLLNLVCTALAHEVVGWPEQTAFLAAQVITFLASYLFMKYYVRGTADNPVHRELPAFLFSSIIFRGWEVFLFTLLIKSAPLHYLILATMIKVGFFIGKFFFYRVFVFKHPSTSSKNFSEDRADRDRDLFDSIAEDITRKDLDPASSPARRLRIQQSVNLLPYSRVPSLLETGCGAGFGARYIFSFYGDYTGIDYSAKHIERARAINSAPNRSFICSSLEAFPPGKQFDVILMVGVLHHMENPTAQLSHCYDLLKPGGHLVLNEPQEANPLWKVFRRIRQKIDPAYSSEQEFVNPSSLSTQIKEAGFSDCSFRGQGFFSTPFAEVIWPAPHLMKFLSLIACSLDQIMERLLPGLMRRLSWNLIAVARKTGETPSSST